MPSIVAVPYPDRGHVLLEINLADVPGATHACVTATTATLTRQLHPYISYNTDGCIALSCGQAILWDVEAGCDTPITYTVTAVNAAGEVITTPADPLVLDTFTRVEVASWGAADSGQVWVSTGGAAADHSVTGARGRHSLTDTAVQRTDTITVGTPNHDVKATFVPGVVAVGNSFEGKLVARRTVATDTDYRATIRFNVAGTLTFVLERNSGGVLTSLGSVVPGFGYNATTHVDVRLRVWGNQITARVWDTTTPEPLTWNISVTDATITDGVSAELRSQRLAGNANGTVDFEFDNFSVGDVCADAAPVAIVTDPVTLACDGCFRLSDPVRPCNEVSVCDCAEGADCGGGGGIMFGGITGDTYDANSGQMLPVNGIWPITISRNRRAPTGSLTVMPRSFADRDELLEVLQPGGVLLWRGPGEFGIGDRYIAVGDVPVSPVISDLRQQQRLVELPFAVSAPVVGPTQGICGARVGDLCETYATWDELIAAGLTYADLLRGDAGGVPSGLATWADINADHASWGALQVAETDWADVLDGD